jgi:hypothetical protein
VGLLPKVAARRVKIKGEVQFLKNGTKKKKNLKIEEDQRVDDLEGEGVVALPFRRRNERKTSLHYLG